MTLDIDGASRNMTVVIFDCRATDQHRQGEKHMSEGQIRTEVHGHIFKIIIDNAAKKNAFTPVMMEQLSDALTELHDNEAYRVGVICAEGRDFTAGLDMPKFFGPTAEKRNTR